MKLSNLEKIPVHTWYLHYTGTIRPVGERVQLFCWNTPSVDQYLKYYRTVGEPWGWTGRLMLTKEELEKMLQSEVNEVWLFYVDEKLRGFFEINRSVKNEAELVYLGLFPDEIGRGFGKMLLDAAVKTASQKAEKVWLHTCEFDHPRALSAYLKAGFSIEHESVLSEYYPTDFIKKKFPGEKPLFR